MLDLHRRVPVIEVERAGLTVIEAIDESVMVAFPTEPDMREFVRRCEAYEGGPSSGQVSAPYEALFDSVRRVRSLSVDDVLDSALPRDGDEVVRVDVSGWCPDDRPEAERRHAELRGILEQAGAEIQDSALDLRVGLSAFRADVSGARLVEIAATERVRAIRRCPRPVLGRFSAFRAAADELPAVRPPASRSPIVGIVDSGIRAEHPLIRPALRTATSVGGLPPHDASGHGTLVASLALYGSLEEHLHGRSPVQAAAGLVSVRVLDENDFFPDAELWERDLELAVATAADAGARIIVLSLGDLRSPYRPPGPVPVAAVVDRLARSRGLVIVVSAGNTVSADFPREDGLEHRYPEWLLQHREASLLPPAMASLALTTGGIVGGYRQGLRPHSDDVHQRPMGRPDHPSAHTRCGPGVENAVKPELVAPAGTPTFLIGEKRVADDVRTSHIVGAAGGGETDRLLSSGSGTSFAAPIVAHAAARVLDRYPNLTANAVRALVLAGVEDVPAVVEGETESQSREQRRRLTGHGKVNAERSTNSTDHRAMLLAEAELPVDGVHFYTVPIPGAFFRARQIVVRATVAHDPPVRATRLDYLANRMQVHVFRGVDLDQVRRKYEEDARVELGAPADLRRHHLGLQPAASASCHAANQCATVEFAQAWDAHYRGTDLVVVVRNTKRWDDEPTQAYALCVMLETDENAEPLYEELRVRLEAVAEVEIEAET
ncbi:S8 family peptidase [Actinomycetospora rhizophila]|uniref:S8 family peptidase n=1 Tax=Actinomycetospora rhizophila TaxID=1416876 RepID=A0ABV9Z7L5_9PSEU